MFFKHISFVFWNRISFLTYLVFFSCLLSFYEFHALLNLEIYNDLLFSSIFSLISRSYSSQTKGLNVNWVSLDENGVFKDSSQILKNQAAIYIYQFNLDKTKIYIGSAINIRLRFNQHKNRVKAGSTGCPIFYNSLLRRLGGITSDLVF